MLVGAVGEPAFGRRKSAAMNRSGFPPLPFFAAPVALAAYTAACLPVRIPPMNGTLRMTGSGAVS